MGYPRTVNGKIFLSPQLPSEYFVIMRRTAAYIAIVLTAAVAAAVSMEQVEKLLSAYRDAFNSGDFERIEPLLAKNFSYSGFEPKLSRSILESFVYLAPYSVEDILDINLSPAGKDSTIVAFKMIVSYSGIKDTIPQAFVVVKEGDSLKIGAIIDPDIVDSTESDSANQTQ